MTGPVPEIAAPPGRRARTDAPKGWGAAIVLLTLIYGCSVVFSKAPDATFVSGPGSEALVALGAKIDRLVSAGQWWRLVTSALLHVDLLHLAVNALWLGLFGVAAARIGGLGRSLAAALLAGTLGQGASWLWVAAGSVGASGAVYGLAGLLAVDAWRFRARLPQATQRRLLPGLLAMLAVLLLAPLALSDIDHAAHVGGVVGGALVGLTAPGSRAARAVEALAGALLVAALAWAAASLA